MGQRDLHNEPFDESTLAKLGIFEDYAGVWIPTFVMSGYKSVYIFDFFAGPGFDTKGVPGSPIRFLNMINMHIGNILDKGVQVTIHLNEINARKYDLLANAGAAYLAANPDVARAVKLKLYCEDFETLFPKLLPFIAEQPSLVFLDQNGVRFLSPRYLEKLEGMRQTDFLCFLSASYLWRFGEIEEFKKHMDLDMDLLRREGYKAAHRSVVKQLKDKLGPNTRLRLYPFSLQKGSNIYGLIFGASHRLAVEKFLDIAWTVNNINGEANFDIDDDVPKRQGNLFEANLTKIEAFEESLRNKVLTHEIRNNSQAYDFCHSEGHPGKHASELLIRMKKAGEITFDGRSALVNYRQIYKNQRIMEFVVV